MSEPPTDEPLLTYKDGEQGWQVLYYREVSGSEFGRWTDDLFRQYSEPDDWFRLPDTAEDL